MNQMTPCNEKKVATVLLIPLRINTSAMCVFIVFVASKSNFA